MTKIKPPSPPVVGGIPARHSGEGNHPFRHVVIHSAVIPCEPGRARQLGAWNRDGTTGGSWHYATDPGETIQCSYDRFVCHAAPPNGRKIHIEMADWPSPWPAGASATRKRELRKSWRWVRPGHIKMLRRTARLTARLLVSADLPVQYVNAEGLKANRGGWTTHAQVTKAFGQSTHWDPGFWPRVLFGRMVKRHARRIRRKAARR